MQQRYAHVYHWQVIMWEEKGISRINVNLPYLPPRIIYHRIWSGSSQPEFTLLLVRDSLSAMTVSGALKLSEYNDVLLRMWNKNLNKHTQINVNAIKWLTAVSIK